MASTRGSSLWRNLAAAFGDGLAFGVAMKITQGDARTDRLAKLEKRLHQIERTPAALPAPQLPPQRPAANFDQQVLQAVVNALEARLREQEMHVERRLADLEARITIELRNLHEQVGGLAAGADSRLRELQSEIRQEVAAVRRDAGEAIEASERRLESKEAKLRSEIAAADVRVAAAHARAFAVEAALDVRARELEQGWQKDAGELRDATRAVNAKVAEVESALETRAVELRSETEAACARAAAVESALAARTRELQDGWRKDADTRAWDLNARLTDAREGWRKEAVALRDQAAAAAAGAAALEARLGLAQDGSSADAAALRAEISTAQARIAAAEAALNARIESEIAESQKAWRQEAAALQNADARTAESERSIDARLATVEASLVEKDATIHQLLAASRQGGQQVYDLLLGIGRLCGEAARQVTPAEQAQISAPDPAPAADVLPTATDSGSETPATAEPVAAAAETVGPEPPAQAPGEIPLDSLFGGSKDAVPDFARSKKPGRVWRIPLVS